jgi:adenylate kinase family enzyme
MGDIFRERIPQMSSWVKNKLDVIQKSGRLQHPLIAASMWTNAFYGYEGGSFVFEGSPRTEKEAKMMLEFFDFFNIKMNIFWLNVSDEEAKRRMIIRDREDSNTDATIAKKLGSFQVDVLPAIEYIGKTKPLYEIAEADIETVHNNIMNIIATSIV